MHRFSEIPTDIFLSRDSILQISIKIGKATAGFLANSTHGHLWLGTPGEKMHQSSLMGHSSTRIKVSEGFRIT